MNEGTLQGHEYINKNLVSNGVYRIGDAGVDSIERFWANSYGAPGPAMSSPYYNSQGEKCQDFEGGTYCASSGYVPTRFTDVPYTQWAHRYIEWASREGIVGGYSDGTFKPSNLVTRAQLSKMVVNAFSFPAYTPSQPTFCDVDATLGNLYTSVETLVNQGIISGYQPGSDACRAACGTYYLRCFLPGNPVTRAQMTKFVGESARSKWGISIESSIGGPDYWDVPTGDAFYTYIRTLQDMGAIRYKRGDGDPQCPYGTDCQDMGHFFWGWSATRSQVVQLLHETIYSLYCPPPNSCPRQ